ncbi:MAG: hypothetical protein Q8J92_14630 [Parvibaculum sp.]|nr:hypothetical protein [Parvibaculum sp.]
MLTKTQPEFAKDASDWKRTGAHRLRIGVAIAIFAMAACADEAASDRNARPAEAAATTAAQSSHGPGIAIAALSGAPMAEAAIFAALLKEEAAKARLPVADGEASTYEISGAMDAGENAEGAYVVTVIDVRDATGARVHRVVNEETLPLRAGNGDPWAHIARTDLRRIAGDAAARLAVWYASEIDAQSGAMTTAGSIDNIVTGSIAASTTQAPQDRLPFDIIVGAAPGDGNAALTRALDSALARRVPTATWLRNEGYKIEGSIFTASRNDGRTEVSIHWIVTSLSGETLGEVKQRNALDAASIAGNWGKLAENAAEAAAEGVMALLAPSQGRS